MAQWRVRLDVPYAFPVVPGFVRSVHAADFRPDAGSLSSTWRDPVTGLVMLKPSHVDREFTTNLKALTAFRQSSTPGFWQAIKRGGGNLMTSVRPQNQSPGLIDLLISIATMAIAARDDLYDNLKWALESTFTLAVDEGWTLHYQTLYDEIQRKQNWLAVQWDNIGLHFSPQGTCRVYQYDRTAMSAPPVQVHEFDYAQPGEITNSYGEFTFQPIPTYGLLFYHTHMKRYGMYLAASARSGVARGHLIPWDSWEGEDGTCTMFQASPVRLAVNPFQRHAFGLQTITYASTGTFTDAAFDPGFPYEANPSAVEAIPLNTSQQGVMATLRKTDDSGAWVAGVDRQGRVRCSMSTSDSRYTPYLYGYGVQWDPQFATRNTTPLLIPGSLAENFGDKWLRIELTDDYRGRIEGRIKLLLQTVPGWNIALCGDATCVVEYSTDGLVWNTAAGGFATNWDVVPVHTAHGTHLECDFAFRDVALLLEEQRVHTETAFDRMTVANAVQQVLRGCNVEPIEDALIPAEWTQWVLPPHASKAGGEGAQEWRLAARAGQNGWQVLHNMLLFMRSPGHEWRLRWDWAVGYWVPELRACDPATWLNLVNTLAEENAGSGCRYDVGFRMAIDPPEANLVSVRGATRPDAGGRRVQSPPLINYDSLYTPGSPDYLGRVKPLRVAVPALSDQDWVNYFARLVYDAVAHRRISLDDVPIPALHWDLAPNVQVKMYSKQGAVLFQGWIKRRTVLVEREGLEHMALGLDSEWAGDLEA